MAIIYWYKFNFYNYVILLFTINKPVRELVPNITICTSDIYISLQYS